MDSWKAGYKMKYLAAKIQIFKQVCPINSKSGWKHLCWLRKVSGFLLHSHNLHIGTGRWQRPKRSLHRIVFVHFVRFHGRSLGLRMRYMSLYSVNALMVTWFHFTIGLICCLMTTRISVTIRSVFWLCQALILTSLKWLVNLWMLYLLSESPYKCVFKVYMFQYMYACSLFVYVVYHIVRFEVKINQSINHDS